MKSKFEVTDLGLLRYLLGIEVNETENDIFISQANYVVDILERFKMKNIKFAPTPTIIRLKLSKEDRSSNANLTLYKSMIGGLMYLTATRLDIMYAVSLVSRFMETPKETHCQATKRILRSMKLSSTVAKSSYVVYEIKLRESHTPREKSYPSASTVAKSSYAVCEIKLHESHTRREKPHPSASLRKLFLLCLSV
eukprot:PITA_13996